MWNYRLIRKDKRVVLAEVFYDELEVPAYYAEVEEIEGYHSILELTEGNYDETLAVDNVKKTLRMMLDDIQRNPTVLDPDTDFTGVSYEDSAYQPFSWDDLDDDI